MSLIVSDKPNKMDCHVRLPHKGKCSQKYVFGPCCICGAQHLHEQLASELIHNPAPCPFPINNGYPGAPPFFQYYECNCDKCPPNVYHCSGCDAPLRDTLKLDDLLRNKIEPTVNLVKRNGLSDLDFNPTECFCPNDPKNLNCTKLQNKENTEPDHCSGYYSSNSIIFEKLKPITEESSCNTSIITNTQGTQSDNLLLDYWVPLSQSNITDVEKSYDTHDQGVMVVPDTRSKLVNVHLPFICDCSGKQIIYDFKENPIIYDCDENPNNSYKNKPKHKKCYRNKSNIRNKETHCVCLFCNGFTKLDKCV